MSKKNGGDLRYIHQDHLTSTALAIKYYPYGECRNSTGNLATDILFTGQRLDCTGLYYYGARYYDSTIGRFISADPIVPDPMNPQSLNRYTYCLNNPLKYIDPMGYSSEYWLESYYDDSGTTISPYPNLGYYIHEKGMLKPEEIREFYETFAG